MFKPNVFLLVSLGLVIGLGLGFLVGEEKASKLRTRAKSAMVLVEESQTTAESCLKAYEETIDVVTEYRNSLDTMFDVSNKLVDIIWDWDCTDIMSLKATPKPEPLTSTVSNSPGEVIF